MNYISLLCVERKIDFDINDIWILILPLILIVSFLCGVVLVCKYFGKKELNEKRKFKIGFTSFVLFIILTIVMNFLISSNSEKFIDACGGYSPLFSLINSILNLISKVVPLYFLVKAIILFIKFSFLENKSSSKKKLKSKIIRNILIAVLIFILATVLLALFGIFVKGGTQWSQCWC